MASIPAGVAQMGLSRFMVLTKLGSVVWNAVLIGAGSVLGANWREVTGTVGSISDTVLVLAGVALVGGRRHMARAPTPHRPDSTERRGGARPIGDYDLGGRAGARRRALEGSANG